MDSILDSTKKKIGLDAEYTHFDDGEIIDHINSIFADLYQLGIGPSDGFTISDSTAKWSDFIGDSKKLTNVKTYMFLRLRLIFDPPQQSAVLTSYQEQIQKLEWRLNSAAESDASTT